LQAVARLLIHVLSAVGQLLIAALPVVAAQLLIAVPVTEAALLGIAAPAMVVVMVQLRIAALVAMVEPV
jgi:hypothetical protein